MRLLGTMDSSEGLQGVTVKGLNSKADTVNTGRLPAVNLLAGDCTGIRLEGNLGIRQDVEGAAECFGQLMDLSTGKS